MKATNNSEWVNFTDLMTKLLKVPHSELKARLDAEKAAKTKKRRPKSASASRAAGGVRRDNSG